MRNWLGMNPSTLALARGEIASLRPRGKVCRVSCAAGRLWVTASGRGEDSVLAPGDAVTFTGRGRIVIEALRTATVRFEVHAAARQKAGGSYPVTIVELEEGPRVIAQMADVAGKDVKIGMPVRAELRRIYSEEGVIRYGFKFVPDPGRA